MKSRAFGFTRRGRLILPVAFISLLACSLLSAQVQSFSVLYNFSNSPDGASPDKGTLVLDPAGNLYGTTYAGGIFSQGTIFKLDPSGNETVLYHFRGLKDGAGPIGGLVLDSTGNFYGTTSYKGSFNAGTLFKLTAPHTGELIHTFSGNSDGAQPYAALLRDRQGNLYGTTKGGGSSGNGIIFRVDPSGHEIVVHSFTGTPTDGAQPTATLIRDTAGNCYGTASSGGLFQYGTIFKLDNRGVETTLHDFTGSGDGISPLGAMVRDAAGNLYGTTSAGGALNLGSIFKLDPSGRELWIVNFGGSNGSYPVGDLILDDADNIYGTTAYGGDFDSGTVFRVTTAGDFRVLHSFNGSDGNQPYAGLARDKENHLYGTTRFGGARGFGVIFTITP